MKRWCALFLIIFLSVAFVVSDALATPVRYRVGHEPVAMMADGVVARPLGLASTIIGSVFFVVTLPFTIPSDSVDAAKRQMIDYPAWFTFKRPLGEFGRRYERPIIKKTNKTFQSTKQSTNATTTTEVEPIKEMQEEKLSEDN